MQMMVNWNGTLMPLSDARIPVFDHAYLYGDGLFEGIRIYNRRIFKLDAHLKRLYGGCRHLDIQGMIPYEVLEARIIETVRHRVLRTAIFAFRCRGERASVSTPRISTRHRM